MPYISIESGRLATEQKKPLIERLTAVASEIMDFTGLLCICVKYRKFGTICLSVDTPYLKGNLKL